MIDKVQKIRKEVQRLQDLTMDKNKNFYSEAAEGEYNALCNIEHFIDSLQEEPEPQFKVGDIIRSKVWELAVHEIVSIDDGAYYFENGGMVRFDDQKQWELVEEPVSEDLEEAAIAYNKKAVNAHNKRVNFAVVGNIPNEHFIAGAKWQEEKDNEEKVLTYKHGFNDCKEHIKEVLLSEILPCFMHGGEADEVMAKLDEILN